jgi:hypothetical protein
MPIQNSSNNRVKTFDDKYFAVVQEMNQYLKCNGLNMISWTDDRGNSFKIHLSKKYFSALQDDLEKNNNSKQITGVR